MRIAQAIVTAALCSFLTGCQTLGQAQFTVPEERVDVLMLRLAWITRAHGMQSCLEETHVIGAISCFKEGDTSYTFLGARRVNAKVIVDLGFRSTGVGGQLFDQLQREVGHELRELYGASVELQLERSKMVPIERSDA